MSDTRFIALKNLEVRIKDIDLLLEAQDKLMIFSKADDQFDKLKKENKIKDIEHVIKIFTLIMKMFSSKSVGKGRPLVDAEAINKAAYILCVAHFQGFIDELFKEVAKEVISKKVNGSGEEIEKIIKSLSETKYNPRVDVINKLFATIGFYNIVDEINWQKMSNNTVKDKIKNMIEIRNKIAHGSAVIINNKPKRIDKSEVRKLKDFVNLFARTICDVIKSKL
ncbi:HEPN domain-containing protein [Actinobacillus porcinus]|uniref:HEPN domain-containing protein n=1 Tax=Actinobacillus porcinus TaxID=51048 RepID=UPI002353B557|nr:HEPN domain-containing protein [Actinobacillus porcinus]